MGGGGVMMVRKGRGLCKVDGEDREKLECRDLSIWGS